MKAISEEEDPDDQLELYVQLAKMHPGQANKILKVAEMELPKFDAFYQTDAIQCLSPAYVRTGNAEGLKVLLPKLEASLDRDIEELKVFRNLSLSYHQGMIALAEKDKQAFEDHFSAAKQVLIHLDGNAKEHFESLVERMEALGEKTFPTDPMILKEQKV
mgnify:CR=1 FL=1